MKHLARSLLFVPGDRPDRFDKAAASGAHQVVIDLEDAVAPAAKVTARDAAASWLQEASQATAVRINAADTEWFNDDLAMVAALPANVAVMVAKADLDSIRLTISRTQRPVIGLIETVRGFMQLRELAATEGLSRIAFGSVDFGTETGIADEGDAMTTIRTQIVLESCFAGLEPPIDGVSVGFDDPRQMEGDASRSRQLGFGGKLCIHPRQVAVVNAAFQPSDEQLQWAHRVVEAMEASQGGATTVDGKMVDKPVVEQARRIIADAEHSGDV